MNTSSTQKVKLFWRLLPLVILTVAVIFLWRGLSLQPNLLPSALLNKPLPSFNLPNLLQPAELLTERNFSGEFALVNVWASWCETCRNEHAFLMQLAASKSIALFGLNYKDKSDSALKWLQALGNPYQKVMFDQKGVVAIDWGVYGTPETFLIDKRGVVRYRHVGAMTMQVWQEHFLPLIQSDSVG